MSNEQERQWADRLEVGAEDDELLALAARLRRAGQATRPAPPLAFQQQLRRDLLNQHAAAPEPGASLWRWAGSLAAVALLAVVVGLMWLSLSSAGRSTFGGSPPPAYQLLEHTVSMAAPPGGGANPPGDSLAPDVILVVDTRWSLPPEAGEVMAFVHLLDANGQVIAQADAPLQPTADATAAGQATATASLTVASDVAANAYKLVAGLYDPATGARLPLGSDGATTVRLGEVPVAQPIETTAAEGPAPLPPPEGSARLETSSTNASDGLTPGATLEFSGSWHIPTGLAAGTDVMAFVHLRNEAGETVAQADGALTMEGVTALTPTDDAAEAGAWLFHLPLVLPDDLPPGDYLLVTGLVGANGQHLPVVDLAVSTEIVIGPVTIGRPEHTDPKITVLAVSPAAGAVLSGTQPITFNVRLAYNAVSPPALLEIRIAETVGENGRGVATAQVTLDSTSGEITLPVVLHPAQELNAPAKLGLWLQLRADAASPPQLVAWPEGYRWRYNP